MKICLCISGQVRGELQALRQLKQSIEKLPSSVEVTVIFSVWEKTGAKLDGALGLFQMGRIFESDLAEIIPSTYYGNAFWTHFTGLYERLLKETSSDLQQDLVSIFPDAILDIEPEIMDLEMPAPKSNIHVKRMLYKIWRCNKIKKKLEVSQGPFDAVMRLRPDAKTTLTKSLATMSFSDDKIYIPGVGDRPGRTNDVVALGSSQALDRYADLFSKTLSGDWTDIHLELNGWLREQGLRENPPSGFEALGLEANKLLSFADIKGANPFVDLLGLLYHNLAKASCLKTIDRELEKRTDRGEKNSLYHMRSRFFTAHSRPKEALNAFLRAEFSSEVINDFSRDRTTYLLQSLLKLCRAFPACSPATLVAKIDPDISANQLLNNLERVFALPLFASLFQASAIEQAFNAIGIDALLADDLPEGLPDHLADLYRDQALALEKKDLSTALLLMSRAQKIRPKGPFIQDKLKEYKIRLN